MSSAQNEQSYFMHNLEIISLMLRDQEPSELANVAMERSAQEKERDEIALLQVRMKEQELRQTKTKQYTGARFVQVVYIAFNVLSSVMILCFLN